jgi:hypothetical protein
MPREDRAAREALTMLTMAALLASFTHYFGFLLALAAFFTCFLLVDSRHRADLVPSPPLGHYRGHDVFGYRGGTDSQYSKQNARSARNNLRLTERRR